MGQFLRRDDDEGLTEQVPTMGPLPDDYSDVCLLDGHAHYVCRACYDKKIRAAITAITILQKKIAKLEEELAECRLLVFDR